MTDRFTLSNNCSDRRAGIQTGRDRLNVRGQSKSAECLLKIHHFLPAGEKNLSFVIHVYQIRHLVQIKTHFMKLDYELCPLISDITSFKNRK